MWGHGHNYPPIFKYFDETKDVDISKWKPIANYEFFNEFDWVRESNNYPAFIGRELNCKITNESIFGGSLQRVIRKTYNWIFNNFDKCKDTLFILEWPSGVRGELYSEYHKRYVNYTSGLDNFDNVSLDVWKSVRNFYMEFVNEEKIDELDLYTFIGLLSFLKNNNFNYLIVFIEHSTKLEEINNKFVNSLITPYLIDFEDSEDKNSLSNFYYNYHNASFANDTKKRLNDNHNSIRGSKLIAEKIIKNIKKRFYE
jgi:hypothetical protein